MTTSARADTEQIVD